MGTTRWWPPLPSATNNERSADLDVGQPQPEHLAAAQAAEHHGEDHGPVPMGAQRTNQCVDVTGREDLRQASGAPAPAGTVRTRPPRRRVESPCGTGFVSTVVSPRATRYA